MAVRRAEENVVEGDIKALKAQYDRDVKTAKVGLRMLEKSLAYTDYAG